MADDDKDVLQRFVDSLFRESNRAARLDTLLRAEAFDLPEELMGIVNLLPPGNYTRHMLCNQLNSSLKGHGWNGRYGTVE
jgi:hypothetical protein